MNALVRRFSIVACLALELALSACAAGPKVVDHAFGFDARVDSPGIEVLAFRYGNGDYLATQGGASSQAGPVRQSANINGPIPLGDSLYVKWRDKASLQEFEERVELKSRLPRDMERKRVYFVVQGRHLYVYLTDLTKPRPASVPIVGPFRVQSYLTDQIHPATSPK
jgi:hypothetical protein